MNPRSPLLVAVAAAVMIVLAALASGVLPPGPKSPGGSTTTCAACFQQEPIVDILSPALGNSTSASNTNRTVVVQAGSSNTFEVDIYPTLDVNVTMRFSSVLVYSAYGTGAGQPPAATFEPAGLSIGSNAKGVTYMTLYIPQTAQKGTYDSVVSAVDDSNSSYVWGLYFQLVVN